MSDRMILANSWDYILLPVIEEIACSLQMGLSKNTERDKVCLR